MNRYRILPKVDGFTRIQVVAAIKAILVMDRETRIDCLKQMVENLHTKREKTFLTAIEEDNKGFNKVDLPRMFMIYKNLKNGLTTKDDNYLRNHLPHYAEQYITLLGTKKTVLLVNTYYKE